MAEFKSKDFENILYPVHTLKKGMDIFDILPELLDYKEFTLPIPASIKREKLFTYIVYAYDSKSPYVTKIDNIKDRKIQAALDAGFRTTDAKGFTDSVLKMLNCENDNINEMIIRYLRIQGKDITGLAVDQEAYYQINLRIIRGLAGNDDEKDKQAEAKAKLSKQKDDMRLRLEENARNFLEQEIAIGLHKKLWELAEDEAEFIKLTPEDYATEV